jgi:NADH-quinone oxidoreductase subunit L
MSFENLHLLVWLVPLAPLAGAIAAGLFGKFLGRAGSHVVTIALVAVSFLASLYIFRHVVYESQIMFTGYQWLTSGDHALNINVGFLVDRMSAMMMVVVTGVSLMVHIYTIGYMKDDPGYQRFFSYISLFTFSMLMLVMADNFIQLFFGWEAVGLVSYLLIGFWYTRPTAIYANLKAFLVNRVGDFGFLLGIGLVLMVFNTADYQAVFQAAPGLAHDMAPVPGVTWNLMTTICVLLFIGAMGKSAQFPLHVWLPDSMEGPTPISALIHAATMVTAGIFMVARMSPLFELSETALSLVMIIGAITALFMGFLGIIQNDIKRVIAYSTLSQLGYMTVALGASAYSAALFHLMTHAFFKALLFLAAGSVIIGMHHDQDIRNMGGLRKYMPITWITFLIGSLALIGTPLFAGFYSKTSILEAVEASSLPVAPIAYGALVLGVFVTAFYSFRLYFLVFHGKERFGQTHHDHEGDHADEEVSADHHHGLAPGEKPHESPWVVWLPLVLLAIPSVVIGYIAVKPLMIDSFFRDAIYVSQAHYHVIEHMREEFAGPGMMALHDLDDPVFWMVVAGVLSSWFLYMRRPDLPGKIRRAAQPVYTVLENNYYFDRFNDWFFAGGARGASRFLWKFGDVKLIDGLIVNGTARLVGAFSGVLRTMQTGYVYHYAFWMIIGVSLLLTVRNWFE